MELTPRNAIILARLSALRDDERGVAGKVMRVLAMPGGLAGASACG